MLDFAYIQQRTRQLSGRLSENQISTADLTTQINAFYTVDLNVHVRYPEFEKFVAMQAPNDVPVNPLLAEFTACGAALNIILSSGDMGKYEELMPFFQMRLTMIQQDLAYRDEIMTPVRRFNQTAIPFGYDF